MTDNSEQQTSTTPTKPKKGFFGYAWRTVLWFLVILYFALGAAWLGARYCLAPYLNDHKSKIENKISQVLDIPRSVRLSGYRLAGTFSGNHT